MKNLLLRTILAAMVMLFVIQLPSFAFDQYESMKVGETKTFYFPSEVTSKASSMYSYSCTSDYINNVEIVSYTKSSVTVKAIAYTKYTVNIRFDYWWTENGYSKTDTHKVHIDLSDSDGQVTPIGGDYNPNNYFWDKGSWGIVTIKAGETDFFYCQFKNSESDPNVKSIVWSSYGQIGYEILSQNSTSCIIKGNYECNGQKLWCLMKYGSTSYRAYYTINVKESDENAIAINCTNFPDNNFRSYLLSQDYGKDGKLTESEIKNIHYIAVDNKEIKSLQGIDYFTALDRLDCYCNQLSSIDVSKNTALTKLFCDNNQLASIDVSKNALLFYLDCSRNQLTSLNVSNNIYLKELSCYRNQIKGEAMDNLIKSLPLATSGEFYVILDSESGENICTKLQVAEAKAKGWIAKCWGNWEWVEYEGSDEATAINDVKSQPNVAGDAAIYSLSGQRLAAPRKGLNIIDGKKVVMK